MATMKIMGCKAYLRALYELEKSAEGSIKKAVYEGARIIAEECSKSIDTIPVDSGIGTPEKPVRGITEDQKWGLEDSFGLSEMRNDNGYINTKAGFSGYNTFRTKKYPNGQPNVMIARAVESGTSFRQKHPFIRPAVSRSKHTAIYAMDKQINEDLKAKGF